LKSCMLRVEIHEFASNDFNEAIQWYNSQSKGLGSRFKKAVVTQIGNIRKNPSWYPKEEEDIYKVYIPKFPYKILFTFDSKKVVVWAIAHLHRKPSYWKSRKS